MLVAPVVSHTTTGSRVRYRGHHTQQITTRHPRALSSSGQVGNDRIDRRRDRTGHDPSGGSHSGCARTTSSRAVQSYDGGLVRTQA